MVDFITALRERREADTGRRQSDVRVEDVKKAVEQEQKEADVRVSRRRKSSRRSTPTKERQVFESLETKQTKEIAPPIKRVSRVSRVSVSQPLSAEREAEIMSLDSRMQTFNRIMDAEKEKSAIDRDTQKEKELKKAEQQLRTRLETADFVVKKEKNKIFVTPEVLPLITQSKIGSFTEGGQMTIESADLLGTFKTKEEQTPEQKRRQSLSIEERLREDIKGKTAKLEKTLGKLTDISEAAKEIKIKQEQKMSVADIPFLEKTGRATFLKQEITEKDVKEFGKGKFKLAKESIELEKAKEKLETKLKEKKKAELFKKEFFSKEVTNILVKAKEESKKGEAPGVFSKEFRKQIGEKLADQKTKLDLSESLKTSGKNILREIPLVELQINQKKQVDSIFRQLEQDFGLKGQELKFGAEVVTRTALGRQTPQLAIDILGGFGAEIIGKQASKQAAKQAAKIGSKAFAKTTLGKILQSPVTAAFLGTAVAGATEGAVIGTAEEVLGKAKGFKGIDLGEVGTFAAIGAVSAGVISGSLTKLAQKGKKKTGAIIEGAINIADPLELTSDIGAELAEKGFKLRKAKIITSTTTKETFVPKGLSGKEFTSPKVLSPTVVDVEKLSKIDVFTKEKIKPLTEVDVFSKTDITQKIKPFAETKTIVKEEVKIDTLTKPIVPTVTKTKTKIADELFAVAGAAVFLPGFGQEGFGKSRRTRGKTKTRKILDLFEATIGRKKSPIKNGFKSTQQISSIPKSIKQNGFKKLKAFNPAKNIAGFKTPKTKQRTSNGFGNFNFAKGNGFKGIKTTNSLLGKKKPKKAKKKKRAKRKSKKK